MQFPEEHLMYKVPTHILFFPSLPSHFINCIACDSPVRSWRAILCYGPVRPWRPGASSISCAASELHLELHRELSASYRPLGALLSYTIHTHAQSSQQSADSYDTDTLCHNLLAIISTHTQHQAPYTPHQWNTAAPRKTSSPAPPAHTHIPKMSSAEERAAPQQNVQQQWGLELRDGGSTGSSCPPS